MPIALEARLRRLIWIWKADGTRALAAAINHGLWWRWRRVRRRFTRRSAADSHAPWAPANFTGLSTPRVSVVVVSRDEAETLGFALRSIQAQTTSDWECIVIEDGSLDGSREVAQRFVEADTRFRLFVRDRAAGVAESLRRGALLARAPLICSLRSSEMLTPWSLARRERHLATIPKLAAVVGGSQILRLDDEPSVFSRRVNALLSRRAAHPKGVGTPLSGVMCRRTSFIQALGPLDEKDVRDAAAMVRSLVTTCGPIELSDSAAVGVRPRHGTASRRRSPAEETTACDCKEVVARRDTTTLDLADEFDGAVVLVADSEYHVDEIGPLYVALARRGVKTRVMVSPQTSVAARWALARFTPVLLPFAPELVLRAAGLVVMNDWGPMRDIVLAAHQAGVRTFAKVEGVQDFDDVDTGRVRLPYRTAATILGQGQNDVDALSEKLVTIVGSSRLERIWCSPPAPGGDQILVNFNFTYGVLEHARASWMESVERAVADANRPCKVSRHPSQQNYATSLPIARKPFRYEICHSYALVTRFSTVAFEAIARGIPFIYHNPHGERVPTFSQPGHAFPVTDSAEGLVEALAGLETGWERYRERAAPFFWRQIDIVPDRPAEERAADVISEQVGLRQC